ncbi:MAG: carbamoyl phosphate synthase small subunit [Lachnospiraceae bacterium]|nr:carbamoyl phosphate synthase small subunit [Lachnospiraceae bacterium]
MKAYLILEDGTVFTGTSIGANKEVISEIVFNTSMTGYLEVLTDPSYAGQAVTMTYPLIGNYGITRSDMESLKCWHDGFIVRELSRIPSNFRSEYTIQQFLIENDVPGIAGIDTRALTKILREKGTMNGMITTKEYSDLSEILPKIKAFKATKVVEKVTCSEAYTLQAYEYRSNIPDSFDGIDGFENIGKAVKSRKMEASKASHGEKTYNVALLDFGAKRNIPRCLCERGCNVTVYPAHTTAEEILATNPDGIMLSNGPGDPADNVEIIAEVKKLYDSNVPIFAICLGHQLMALATGAKTHKLKYGHRGVNHPVKDLKTGRVYMSSQNHGYVVDEESLDPSVAESAFINVNDKTNEGLSYKNKKIFTVQFHPEACGGPQDTAYLFDRFIEMMGGAL